MQKLCIIFLFIISLSSIFGHDLDFCELMDTEGTVVVEGEYILDFIYLGNCNSSFDKMIGSEGNSIKIITRTSNFYQMFYDVENKTFANLNFIIIPSSSTKPIVDSLFHEAINSVFENITITIENKLYTEVVSRKFGLIFESMINSTINNVTMKFNSIDMKVVEDNEKGGLFGYSMINGTVENLRVIGNELTIRNSQKSPPNIGLLFYTVSSNISCSSVDIKNISVTSPELIELGLLVYNTRDDSDNLFISNSYVLVRKALNIVNHYKVNYYSSFIYKNNNKNLTITKCWINIRLNSLTTKHNCFLNGILGHENNYNSNNEKKKKINILNTQIMFTLQKEYNQYYISIINNELKSNLYMNNSFIFINKINDSVSMSNQISDIYKNKDSNEIMIENTYYSLYGDSLWIKFDERIKYDNIYSIKQETSGYALSKDKSILYYEENPYFDGVKLRSKNDDVIKKIKVNKNVHAPKMEIKSTKILEMKEDESNCNTVFVITGCVVIMSLLGIVCCKRSNNIKEDKKKR